MTKSNWIRVEDNLPQPYDEVLIWPRPELADLNVSTGMYTNKWISWYSDAFGVNEAAVTVTHWQTIEPPE